MSEDKKRIEGMAGVALIIPQLSYDIIARIVPGWVLLFTGLLVFTSSETLFSFIKYFIHDIDANKVSFIVMLMLLLSLNLLAYMISSAVSALVFWISRSVPLKKIIYNLKHSQILKAQKTIIKQINNCYETEKITKEQLPEYPMVFDSIRICFPDAGARLTKTRAEYHMSRVLVLGFALMVIFLFIKSLIDGIKIDDPWVRVLFVYFIGFILVHATRNDLTESYNTNKASPRSGALLKVRKKLRAIWKWMVHLTPTSRSFIVIISIILLIGLVIYPDQLFTNSKGPLVQSIVLSVLSVLFAYYGFSRRRRLIEGVYNHWVVYKYEVPSCINLNNKTDQK